MRDNFIAEEIRRCSRNLLLMSGALLVALLAVAAGNGRYWYNFALGPFPIDRPTLLSAPNAESFTEYFVALEGDDVIDTGYQQVQRKIDKSTRKVTSETPTASYVALVIDRRFLLVKAPLDHAGKTFAGTLVGLPQDLHRSLVAKLEATRPDLRDIFLPFMLDATGFRGEGYWQLAIGIPLLLFGAWNLKKVIARSGDPESHPIMVSISTFGPPAGTATLMDSEVRVEGQQIGRTFITRSWLFHPSPFTLKIVRLSDIAWVYKRVTTHYYVIIPVAKAQAVMIWNREGKSLEIPCKKGNADRIIEEVLRRVPWVVAGYDKELEASWNAERDAFVRAVDERRKEAEGHTG